MKAIIIMGVALIILGIITFANKGITYTTKEKVLDLGAIEATTTKDKTIPLSPLLGVMSLIGGITLVIVGSKTKAV